MKRKLVSAAAVVVLGAIVFTGESNGDNADHPISSATKAPAGADLPSTSVAPRVMHPNVLMRIKCDSTGRLSFTTQNIGHNGRQYMPVTIKPVTSSADSGWDCSFHLEANATGDLYVVVHPVGIGVPKWYFSQTLAATDLEGINRPPLTPGLHKGQEYRVYAQTSSLPKPDSFDSKRTWRGAATDAVKNYNWRVTQMNRLRLNRDAGIHYDKYVAPRS